MSFCVNNISPKLLGKSGIIIFFCSNSPPHCIKTPFISQINPSLLISIIPHMCSVFTATSFPFWLLWFLVSLQFSSVQLLSRVRLCDPMNRSNARPLCPSPTPRVHSDSYPWSQWCHPAISSSVIPFSSCPQSLPASGSFPMSQLFAWSGQSIGVSASTSVLPMNTRDWFPLGWTGWISLQSQGLSRVFSNTTVQKHQFFGAQLSSQSSYLATNAPSRLITPWRGKTHSCVFFPSVWGFPNTK